MFEKTFDEQKINRAVLAGLNSPALSREQNANEGSLEEPPAAPVWVRFFKIRPPPTPGPFWGRGRWPS